MLTCVTGLFAASDPDLDKDCRHVADVLQLPFKDGDEKQEEEDEKFEAGRTTTCWCRVGKFGVSHEECDDGTSQSKWWWPWNCGWHTGTWEKDSPGKTSPDSDVPDDTEIRHIENTPNSDVPNDTEVIPGGW